MLKSGLFYCLTGEDIGFQLNVGVNVSEYNAMTSTAIYACVRVLAIMDPEVKTQKLKN